MGLLRDRVVVVTGASRGAGKGIALALGATGATVYVTGRTRHEGDAPLPGTVNATAAAVTAAGGKGIPVYCDHGNEDNPEVIRFDDGEGHGGGDDGIMRNFIQALHGETTPHQTTARVSLQSHLMCFAAEESRLSGKTIEM